MESTRTTRLDGLFGQPVAAKVPEITALFWVIKVLTTGMGESLSDYLVSKNLLLAGATGLIGFAVAMWLQFRVDRYVASVYWFAVAMVAVFGTLAADGLHVELGVPYTASTLFYALVLATIFLLWWRSERTLSIHSIVTRRRETYYWLTVLATFALGTAAGDWTAATLHLGFLNSAVLFAVVIAIPAVAWWRFNLNPIAAFWMAYVITRPLGASLADWLGKHRVPAKGLGLGDGNVSVVAIAIIVGLVVYVARSGDDVQRSAEPA